MGVKKGGAKGAGRERKGVKKVAKDSPFYVIVELRPLSVKLRNALRPFEIRLDTFAEETLKHIKKTEIRKHPKHRNSVERIINHCSLKLK